MIMRGRRLTKVSREPDHGFSVLIVLKFDEVHEHSSEPRVCRMDECAEAIVSRSMGRECSVGAVSDGGKS